MYLYTYVHTLFIANSRFTDIETLYSIDLIVISMDTWMNHFVIALGASYSSSICELHCRKRMQEKKSERGHGLPCITDVLP